MSAEDRDAAISAADAAPDAAPRAAAIDEVIDDCRSASVALMTLTSLLNPFALCTKRTAARACMPSRFLTCTSRSARDIV